MATQFIQATLEYQWEPFTLRGHHLTFTEHVNSRLEEAHSSHWGPAVYRWRGLLKQGPYSGRVGVLIGETNNLRQRIKQYIAGTQERGNKLWRETFLILGDIRLDVLTIRRLSVSNAQSGPPVLLGEILKSSNQRNLLEQLLIQRQVLENDGSTWIVNART